MVTFALGNKIENGVFLFFFHECRTKKKFSGPLRFVDVHDTFDQAKPSRLQLATQGVLFPRFPLLLVGNQSEKGRCFLTNQDKLNPYNESFRALLTNCAFPSKDIALCAPFCHMIIKKINKTIFVPVLGDVPCIVSSGEGDFVPIRFISGSTVQMCGHSKHHSANT